MCKCRNVLATPYRIDSLMPLLLITMTSKEAFSKLRAAKAKTKYYHNSMWMYYLGCICNSMAFNSFKSNMF